MKAGLLGILVVSLRGVNFGLWSHIVPVFLDHSPSYVVVMVSFKNTPKKYKNLYLISFKYGLF